LDNRYGKYIRYLKPLIGNDYRLLPESIRKNVIERAKRDTNLTEDALLKDKQNIFDIAFTASRMREEDKARIDDFRNQYGFNRNMSFASFLAAFFAYYGNSVDSLSSIVFFLLGIGMMIRFVTFYTSFSAEVLRSYAFEAKATMLEVVASAEPDQKITKSP
jgi:hypothetical protein